MSDPNWSPLRPGGREAERLERVTDVPVPEGAVHVALLALCHGELGHLFDMPASRQSQLSHILQSRGSVLARTHL